MASQQELNYSVSTLKKVVSFVAFQAVWFAVLMLEPFVYVPLVIAFFILHLGYIVPHRRVWLWVARIAVLGWALDSILLQLGVFNFSSGEVIPFWLLALWTMFAFVLMTSVVAFRRYALVLALVSFISAPGTYYAGVQLKAGASFAEPLWQSLLILGVAWGIFVPFVMTLVNRDSLLSKPQREVSEEA